MTQLLKRCLSILTLLLPVLFLSACANDPKSATLRLSDDQELVSSAPADAEDPETNLKDELEALRRTGSWSTTGKNAGNSSTDQGQKSAQTDLPDSDFPLIINSQVQAYLDLFQNQQRKSFTIWLTRAGKYLPMMQKELKEAGLPEDLAYLSMIESGYNQRAYSKAHASGLWQFIPGTGSDYDLKINKYLDERRDAEKSTQAAVKFLGNLYEEFNDWHLAVAAYNAGAGKIGKGLEKYGSSDFWSLAEYDYLAMETKRYVPKLIASIIIAKNPERYGFTNIQMDPPLAYDTLEVGPGLPLDAVALISNCDRKTIDQLNQELSTNKTPLNQSCHFIKIPTGSKEVASKNLPRLQKITTIDYKTHTIGKGDSLTEICNRYDINKTTLLKANNLKSPKLASGQRLRIPFQNIRYRIMPEGSDMTVANLDIQNFSVSQENIATHTIKKGDTIAQIARQYKVPAEQILSWNDLPAKYTLKVGQHLSIPIDQKNKFTETDIVESRIANNNEPHANTVQVKIRDTKSAGTSLIASTPQKDDIALLATQTKKMIKDLPRKNDSSTEQKVHIAQNSANGDSTKTIASNAQKSPKNLQNWYQVQEGDTLWTIAKEFNLSPGQIKQWNKLQSNNIQAGKRLKIKDA